MGKALSKIFCILMLSSLLIWTAQATDRSPSQVIIDSLNGFGSKGYGSMPYNTPKPSPPPEKLSDYQKIKYSTLARSINAYKEEYLRCTVIVGKQMDIPGSADVQFALIADGDKRHLLLADAPDFKNWHWDGDKEETGISQLLYGDKIDIGFRVLGEHTVTAESGETLVIPHIVIIEMRLYD